MKKKVFVNGAYWYIPNVSEIMKAAAHLRSMKRRAPENYFACEFYPETGKFIFSEFTDSLSYTSGAGVSYCLIPDMNGYTDDERKYICNGIVKMLCTGKLAGEND